MATTTSREASTLPPSIAQIVRSLSSRPNVQSTLILSRKDGGIIYASGTLQESSDPTTAGFPILTRDSAGLSSQSNVPAPESSQDDLDLQKEDASIAELSIAQKLAESILRFANAGENLGTHLELSDNASRAESLKGTTLGRDGADDGDRNQATEEDARHEDQHSETQLLRLRTKSQEVIIYPDAKYLCCVIQTIGKFGS